jgi:hypothetical protein
MEMPLTGRRATDRLVPMRKMEDGGTAVAVGDRGLDNQKKRRY